MPINITMPALSPTMEEGTLAKWLVNVGDTVSAGDVIAEIETDKATMEVEAVDEGTVAKLLVDAGSEGVAVNAVIAILAEEGEDPSVAANSDPAEGANPVEGPSVPPSAVTPYSNSDPAEGANPIEPEPEDPPSVGPSPVTPYATGTSGSKVFASPLARRIASEANLDIASISGSGPRGRVIKRDVDAAISDGSAARSTVTQATASAAPLGQSDEQILKLYEEGTYELIPQDTMRKTIARRLVESKQTVPHFYLTVECELDALLALRGQINAAAPIVDEKPTYKVSVNDMIIKALALALRDVPDANVSWSEANMIRHKHCDVGVAVSIPGGLITPIVRNAEDKSLSQIANEMKYLAGRARDRKLLPHEYQGGSSAVSNLGMFGIREFSAVINPPHATILAVGAGEKRAIVKDDEIVKATVMSATLSTDHRAVDGVLGAQLIGAFKRYIEQPVAMLV